MNAATSVCCVSRPEPPGRRSAVPSVPAQALHRDTVSYVRSGIPPYVED